MNLTLKILCFGFLLTLPIHVLSFFYFRTLFQAVSSTFHSQPPSPILPGRHSLRGGFSPAVIREPGIETSATDLKSSFIIQDLLHRKYLDVSRQTLQFQNKQTEEVFFMSYATHGGSDDRFCRCIESIMYHGYRYHLIGWGVKLQTLSDKIFGALVAMRGLPDETIVVFADAYDVLVTGFQEELVSKFKELNTPILFGTEKGCWPFVMFSAQEVQSKNLGLPQGSDGKYICDKHYPPSPTYQR